MQLVTSHSNEFPLRKVRNEDKSLFLTSHYNNEMLKVFSFHNIHPRDLRDFLLYGSRNVTCVLIAP